MPLLRGWRRASSASDTDAAVAGDPDRPVPPTTATVGLIRPMVLRNIVPSLLAWKGGDDPRQYWQLATLSCVRSNLKFSDNLPRGY